MDKHKALIASVAKEIAKTHHGGADISDHYLFGEATGGKVFVDAATAAIAVVYEALREPSEEMIEAYFQDCHRHGFNVHINATTAWASLLSASPIVQEE